MRHHSNAEVRRVRALLDAGLSSRTIAASTGVAKSTVNSWRARSATVRHERSERAHAGWRPIDEPAYAYLLGIYLGDGWISVSSPRAASLVITLDAQYPAVVDEVGGAIDAVFTDTRSTRHSRMGGSVAALQVSNPAVPFAFPQHGPGRKHARPIELVDWQRRVTGRHAERLLRGLIHSDGCRCLNRFETVLPSGRLARYAYPRYFFSNLSADIRRIFCDHCDVLGIRWTQSNSRNISVSHRSSVTLLDEFIGPKS